MRKCATHHVLRYYSNSAALSVQLVRRRQRRSDCRHRNTDTPIWPKTPRSSQMWGYLEWERIRLTTLNRSDFLNFQISIVGSKIQYGPGYNKKWSMLRFRTHESKNQSSVYYGLSHTACHQAKKLTLNLRPRLATSELCPKSILHTNCKQVCRVVWCSMY